MNTKFFVVGQVISIFGYIVSILFPKMYECIFNDMLQLFHYKLLSKKLKSDKVAKKFFFIILFIVIWTTLLNFYPQLWSFIGLHRFYYNHTIYKVGIAIFSFLIGLFVAEGKNIIYMLYNNFNYFIKTFLLVSTYIIFSKLKQSLTGVFILFISFLILIFIVDYYRIFKKEKKEMNNFVFILNFLCFIWILFHIVFIFVNSIINI